MKLKINQHDAGHMIKMAAMPIHGINPLKSAFKELVSRFDETWYEALETQSYYILFN